MVAKNTSVRVGNLEFRWCDFNKSYELVQWRDGTNSEYSKVIAFFNKSNEGYDIRFVGDRPFNVDNQEFVWDMLRYGQKFCEMTDQLYENWG